MGPLSAWQVAAVPATLRGFAQHQTVVELMRGEVTAAAVSSHRRDCHFHDTPCSSLLKHLIKLQGCHQMTVSPTDTTLALAARDSVPAVL